MDFEREEFSFGSKENDSENSGSGAPCLEVEGNHDGADFFILK